MPACGQCGKDNPEGTAFCGYCASPLMTPAAIRLRSRRSRVAGRLWPPQIRGGSPPAPPSSPRPFKPETRTPHFVVKRRRRQKRQGRIRVAPMERTFPGQRAGRVAAGAIVLFLIFFFLRGMLRSVGGARGDERARTVGAMVRTLRLPRATAKTESNRCARYFRSMDCRRTTTTRPKRRTMRLNCSNSPAISRPSAARTS